MQPGQDLPEHLAQGVQGRADGPFPREVTPAPKLPEPRPPGKPLLQGRRERKVVPLLPARGHVTWNSLKPATSQPSRRLPDPLRSDIPHARRGLLPALQARRRHPAMTALHWLPGWAS